MTPQRSLLAFGLLLTLILAPAARPAPGAEPGHFLVVSDLHFDPFFDGKLFESLRREPADRWAEVLRRSQPAGLNPRGTDSNYALVAAALDDAASRLPSPDFLLYPGDFLAHDWAARYDALAPRSHNDDPASYRAFTDKTVRFLAGEFARRFPGTPVLPTLGNEDSYCGDYRVEPAGPFLSMFADAWAPLLGPGVDLPAFRETFGRGGYYTVLLPRARGQRLVVLNSVVFSVNYEDACGPAGATPALDQLRWLDRTLAEARAAGESVWLLFHVPPGINSFNSARSLPAGGPPVTFWQPELTARFLNIIGRHRAAVLRAFAGHTHMDDFRYVKAGGRPALFVKIAPAVSPIFGNNPGYQVYEYDRAGGTLTDYRTFSLAGFPGSADWTEEYGFRSVYAPHTLTPAGIAGLADALKTTPALADAYTRFYGVGAPPEFPPSAFDLYRCAIGNVTPSAFLECLDADTRADAKARGRGTRPDRRPAPAAHP